MSDKSHSARIFLSYERTDQEKVEKLYHMLRGAGYTPWMDTFDILAGQKWADAIKKAVAQSDFFLACMSNASVDKRGVIQKEIRYALDRYQEKLSTDIYLIPVRLEAVDLPEPLNEIQWVDLFANDGFDRLKKAIEAQGFPGIDKPPTPLVARDGFLRDIRGLVFDLMTPSYILDNSFHFLDWNPAFDELVVSQTRIRRGEHALEFIRQLDNCKDVIERSKETFKEGADPVVDVELLHFTTEKYGIVLFQKIASQVVDEAGDPQAWCVSLNIMMAEHLQLLWDDLRSRLEQDANWGRYAVSYDKLLTPFDDYRHLVELVVSLTGDARRCIDVGAGTGNGTVRLLQSRPEREVCAMEPNEAMLQYLRSKVQQLDASLPGCRDRLTTIKDDVLQCDDLPRDYFDGAILINVLYTVDDPQRCLNQIYRILRPGGVLVLSTAHRETNVDQLFGRLREVLTAKGCFEELRAHYLSAHKVHQKLMPKIHRDTKEDIRQYLRTAGFVVSDAPEDWREHEYAGAVLVARVWKV